jgi:hypothetical protein
MYKSALSVIVTPGKKEQKFKSICISLTKPLKLGNSLILSTNANKDTKEEFEENIAQETKS